MIIGSLPQRFHVLRPLAVRVMLAVTALVLVSVVAFVGLSRQATHAPAAAPLSPSPVPAPTLVTAAGPAAAPQAVLFRSVGGSGIAATPSGGGHWVVKPDGGVFTFGDAGFYGSAAGVHLAAPVVAITATVDGKGYWLASADGGVFTFGNAGFFGSAAGVHLAAPVVAITPTADGRGYWLAAADGGVFGFGDAGFYGSVAGIR